MLTALLLLVLAQTAPPTPPPAAPEKAPPVAPPLPPPQAPPLPPVQAKAELTLSVALSPAPYLVGDDVQVGVTLANAGDKDIEAAALEFDERSVAFEVTHEAGTPKAKTFVYAVTRPNPHLQDRLPVPRVTLKGRKSLAAIFRVPLLKTGNVSIGAVYKGGEKEMRSSAALIKVEPRADGADKPAVMVDTTQGSFRIDLLPEEAPVNVANFVSLVRCGFYDNLSFFRVLKGSLIQTGCPYDNGYGDPGYSVKGEAANQTTLHDQGTVSMSGNQKTGYTGSQFLVTLGRVSSFDKKRTVIGKVAGAGLDVIKKIGSAETDKGNDRPKEDIFIKKAAIVVVK